LPAHVVFLTDLHTKNGTAAGADGRNITNIKLPHIGGHEGVGRVIAIADGVKGNVKPGDLVGIR
jgi:D-arabinose 1-dehydrogenase-like Zn-dependent alcohol dehydrogenase